MTTDILARYRAAEAVLESNVANLVLNESIAPQWVGPRTFWYRRQRHDGAQYVWVEDNAARAAFDHAAAAHALGEATGKAVGAWTLAVESIAADGEVVLLADDHRWRFAQGKAQDLGATAKPQPGLLVSPDGKQALFARGFDLYLRELDGGAERRLTDDGEEDFAWGEYPDAGFLAVVRRRSGLSFAPYGWSWSPDGAYVVGGRLDQRHVEAYPFIESVPQDGSFRPRVYNVRQPLVGEARPLFSGYAIEVATGRKIPLDLPEPLVKSEMGGIEAVGWSHDHRRAFIAVMLAQERSCCLYEIDVASGSVRKLIDEAAQGFLNLGAEPTSRTAFASWQAVAKRSGIPSAAASAIFIATTSRPAS
ncbi:MAG: DPP IV N-terminal domain-containing protein [Rubrivivax sp.]